MNSASVGACQVTNRLRAGRSRRDSAYGAERDAILRSRRRVGGCDFVFLGRLAAAAAICFWQSGHHPWLLVVAPLVLLLRLWCNMLDGMVALAAGEASARGEVSKRSARPRFRCADFCRRGAQRLDASAVRILGRHFFVRHGLCRDAWAGGRRRRRNLAG